MPGDVIERKIRCAEEFARLLVQRLGSRVCRVVLFGSVAKGDADADSDIDILVILDAVDEQARRVIAETAFETSIAHDESIEYLTMDIEEYMRKTPDNSLIYEVEATGRILYRNPGSEIERARKLAKLAEEYHSYAEECAKRLMLRAAIDLGQSAVELLLKAAILAKDKSLPKAHGGYIRRFGELYVVPGSIDREIISGLYKVLELRNKSRYEPDYQPTPADVDTVLKTYKRLEKFIDKLFAEEPAEDQETSLKP